MGTDFSLKNVGPCFPSFPRVQQKPLYSGTMSFVLPSSASSKIIVHIGSLAEYSRNTPIRIMNTQATALLST